MNRNQFNTPSYQLLRMLGSPLIEGDAPEPMRESEELFACAFKNRVGLLYLDRLRKASKLDRLSTKYKELREREKDTLITAGRVSSVLHNANIKHVVVKTLRPYPATPNDVDLVCLGDSRMFEEGELALKKAEYILIHKKQEQNGYCDPRGAYLHVEEREVDDKFTGGRYFVDYYRNMAADHFRYIDESKFTDAISKVSPIDGCDFFVLEPLSDLCVIMMHSVFPHQRYGLESFYTMTYCLNEIQPSGIHRFRELVHTHRLLYVARAYLAVTQQIHTEVFGSVPPILKEALDSVGACGCEARNFAQGSRDLPYMFSVGAVMKALLWKLQEWNALKSMLLQGISMISPSFFSEVVFEIKRKRAPDHYRHL